MITRIIQSRANNKQKYIGNYKTGHAKCVYPPSSLFITRQRTPPERGSSEIIPNHDRRRRLGEVVNSKWQSTTASVLRLNGLLGIPGEKIHFRHPDSRRVMDGFNVAQHVTNLTKISFDVSRLKRSATRQQLVLYWSPSTLTALDNHTAWHIYIYMYIRRGDSMVT